MREEAHKHSTRGGAQLQAILSVVNKILFWVSVALAAVLAVLSWAIPSLTALRSFDVLYGAVLGLAVVTSGSLFWQEIRANRGDDEWSPMAWLYATAFGLSLFLSLYMLPALYFAP
jgi:hypothetical protein